MKPYFKSPLHIIVFSLEMTLLFGTVATFVIDGIAWFMGCHHGFFPNIQFDFERFFVIAVLVFTPIFFLDLILYFVRRIIKSKKQPPSE